MSVFEESLEEMNDFGGVSKLLHIEEETISDGVGERIGNVEKYDGDDMSLAPGVLYLVCEV